MRRAVAWVASMMVIGFLAAPAGVASASGRVSAAPAGIPRYDHVFLMIEENHGFGQIIGNPVAPEINALATDYGLATQYYSTSDPSEPNYVAMLGGSDFGINNDNPYWFPGNTVHADNLMSQLDRAGLSWKGYFQGMPYPGYRGFCFPAKCNGIPDADTQYVSKHNGIVNFADLQNATDFSRMVPSQQLTTDLASGQVPALSYIVPDECHDMHGAPPWCVDSANYNGVADNWLVSHSDAYVGSTVNAITASKVWNTGRNAIVVTWDEGNGGPPGTGKVATIVVTNHGPRGLTDPTSYNHYSLLASLQQAFGVGCLRQSCSAAPMAPLFDPVGPHTAPTLPPPYVPPPNGTNAVSQMQTGVPGAPVSLTCKVGWTVVPDPNLGTLDNDLSAVSGASASDVWAVGAYYPPSQPTVLANEAQHYNGIKWTAYALPNVGLNGNTLLGVSDPSSGKAWAVGYYTDAGYQQRTLVEHWDGTTWQVVHSPNPGGAQNILYGVAAVSDSDVWAVGGQEDAFGVWHTLIEHWDGTGWAVVPAPDPASGGNLLYAVSASSAGNVVAAGQQSGTGFPSQALLERWDGSAWQLLPAPADPAASLTPLGVLATAGGLTFVGQRETGAVPFTTLVGSGPPLGVKVAATPDSGTGENDLFSVTQTAGGTTWAAGWVIDPSTLNHETLILKGVDGQWTLVPSPSPSSSGDNGIAGVAAVPGGGVWAVGITTGPAGNPRTLIEHHC